MEVEVDGIVLPRKTDDPWLLPSENYSVFSPSWLVSPIILLYSSISGFLSFLPITRLLHSPVFSQFR